MFGSHSHPPQTIGIIGGGQLALMMLEASQQLGIKVVIQTPYSTDPALHCSLSHHSENVLAPIDDAFGTTQLAQRSRVITFENEFVDIPALEKLEQQSICFRPSLSTLGLVIDKFEQRSQLQRLGLPVPKFATVTAQSTLEDIGFPLPWVIKARRHGYDGQGTHIIQDQAALKEFWRQADAKNSSIKTICMVEEFVPFERELAVIAARSVQGEIAIYPVVETYQPEQVCRWAITPVPLPPQTQIRIERLTQSLLSAIDYVGVMGLELFWTNTGDILINEIAPRTHNSGHLTIEACETSQFSQHLLAVSGRNLGSTSLKAPAALMVNLLGFENKTLDYQPQRQRMAQYPNAHVHWYHKTQARVGRKMGHVTVLLNQVDRAQAITVANEIEAIWYPE